MAELDINNVISHIANDSLSELCLVCLTPLSDITFENIFTLLCREGREYAVADVLRSVCQFKFDGTENFNVCIDCFKFASSSYKFHLQAKQSMEIISHYTEELLNHVENVEVTHKDTRKLLCIPLSSYIPETHLFDFNLDGIGRTEIDNVENDDIETDSKDKKMLLVIDGPQTSCFDMKTERSLKHLKSDSEDEEMIMIINEKKERKKRDPMMYMSCTKCPIKYRFVSKLKEHMRGVHNVKIYYCKVCKIVTENKEEYEEHLKSHTRDHQCTICNAIYKKHETLVAHMKVHEKEEDVDQSENANICEICGAILENERSLQDHVTSRHMKRYTCYYCGRMYKGQASFERHIKKHETHFKKKFNSKVDPASRESPDKETDKQDKSKRSMCQTCGKDFVDERSLLWHQRLHDNDRPFTCEVCGRGFVTSNRRNQHALCAHTPPSRRCPLCPALFHLRSMVNTHLKKVHLKAHKRRSRTSKQQNVFWRTAAVPIQELSVDVQSHVLELQSSRAELVPKELPIPVSALPTTNYLVSQ